MYACRLKQLFFRLILCWGLTHEGLSSHAENFPNLEKLKVLARSREWKLLLHASPLSFNRGVKYHSEADGLNFFMAGNEGSEDALRELEATIAAFQLNKPVQGIILQPARCAFPARRRIIKEKLGLEFPDTCEVYEKWLHDLRPERISLVFAAPYMGSPSSMFGHIFLRIHKKDSHEALLDATLGFEAVTTSSSFGVSYTLRGLMGAFPGLFSLLPYHVKVNQYSHLDSRDLWEFPLNISESDLQKMMEHLWEMQTTYFDYFFFDENCSYHLLSMLEVARPEWHLRDRFILKAIPIDVVKAIVQLQTPLGTLHRRPAILEKIRAGLSKLSRAEQKIFYEFRFNLDKVPEGLSESLLDVLIDWDQYQKFQKSQKLFDPNARVNYRLLALRSKLSSIEEQKSDNADIVPPHLGHASNKISFFAFQKQNVGAGASLRLAFHGLTEWPQGYLKAASLELLELQVEKEKKQKLRVEHFTLVQVESLATFDRLQKDFSWKAAAAFAKPFEEKCERCLDLQLEGGLGFTQEPLGDLRFFMLASGQLRFSPRYDWGTFLLPFLRTGLLWNAGLVRALAEHHLLFALPANTGSQIHTYDQRALFSLGLGQKDYEFKLSYRRAFLQRAKDREELMLSSAIFF